MVSNKSFVIILNLLSVLFIFSVLFDFAFSSSSWAMDPPVLDDSGEERERLNAPLSFEIINDLEQVLEFQRKPPFEPSHQKFEALKREVQSKIDEARTHHLAHPKNKKYVSHHIVKGLREVNDILLPLFESICIILCDLDETLVFSGRLAWASNCFNKNFGIEKQRVVTLLMEHGFLSLREFLEWGNEKFPFPITKLRGGYNFFEQDNVLDPAYAEILEGWQAKKKNIFGFTARNSSGHAYAQKTLQAAKINMEELSEIKITNGKSRLGPKQGILSGIIYSGGGDKFGDDSAGIKFLKAYFEAYFEAYFKESAPPPQCDIILVDNNPGIFLEMISKSNIDAIKDLEEKFKTKIRFKFFHPLEELWLAPQHPNNWKALNFLIEPGSDSKEEMAFKALQEFLIRFRTPPSGPLLDPLKKK